MAENKPKSAKSLAARLEQLDRVIHEKARLGILTSLAAQPEGILFTDLRGQTELTDGNLNRHLKVLVEAGLVKATGSSEGGRSSRTTYRLTPRGLKDFSAYLDHLETVLQQASLAARTARRSSSPRVATDN